MKHLPLEKIQITSPYGMRMHPIEKKMKLHNGVDLKAVTGTKVFAVENGSVALSKFVEGAGECMVIAHTNYYSYYCHLKQRKFVTGQTVKAGDVIAYSGNTGASTGPHLHFGLAKSFKFSNFSQSGWIDPAPEIEALMVKPTKTKVLFNGKQTTLNTIKYLDENYIRIRDIADADLTDKVTVDYDAAKKLVIIKTK